MFPFLPPFVFVIDTEQYAGNFEREFCAYVTGQFGECEVGKDEAEQFKKEFPDDPFGDIVAHFSDENGCRRPVTIWPTPGWFGNGVGDDFRDDGKHDVKAQKYHAKFWRKEATRTHYADAEINRKLSLESLEKALEPFVKCPAYLSVGILMHEKPSVELVDLLKKRSRVYCKNEKIKLTGFRLLRLELVATEIDL